MSEVSGVHRVLFVCMGNICRSPLAEGVFRHQVEARGLEDSFVIDSAGTGAWHAGESPDPRSCEVAARNGVDLSSQRARQVRDADAREFDWIVAMDEDNLHGLERRFGAQASVKMLRLREFDPKGDGDVPDPYYGGPRGFDVVFDMVERSCRALLDHLDPERKL
jgi:low molecular weight protein-tyrosine phosphatase